MTIAENSPSGDLDLLSQIDLLITSLEPDLGHYDSLVFPMIDLNQQVDISWLGGLKTTDEAGRVWEISQAKQQTKFKMNELGARVKSAVAVAIRCLSIARNNPIIIDKPFFLWIQRQGLSYPLLYSYLDYECWSNPGNLEM